MRVVCCCSLSRCGSLSDVSALVVSLDLVRTLENRCECGLRFRSDEFGKYWGGGEKGRIFSDEKWLKVSGVALNHCCVAVSAFLPSFSLLAVARANTHH